MKETKPKEGELVGKAFRRLISRRLRGKKKEMPNRGEKKPEVVMIIVSAEMEEEEEEEAEAEEEEVARKSAAAAAEVRNRWIYE